MIDFSLKIGANLNINKYKTKGLGSQLRVYGENGTTHELTSARYIKRKNVLIFLLHLNFNF